MSDLGTISKDNPNYPLTHPKGWNVLRTDTSATFVKKDPVRDEIFNDFTIGADRWKEMMEQLDKR